MSSPIEIFQATFDPEASWSEQMLELLELQRARLDNLLFVQPRAYYERFTPERGTFFFAVQGARLVGFLLVGHAPAIEPLWHDYITRLGATLEQCCVTIQTLIDPAYRGLGVGIALQRMGLVHVHALGIRHSLMTIHPDNAANLAIGASLGYRELDRTLAYSARLPRVLLHLDIDVYAQSRWASTTMTAVPAPPPGSCHRALG